MGVYKKCKCKDKIRCKDPWWLAKFKGHYYRMPLNDFTLARGCDHFVTSKQEAENVWYPMFLREIAEGKDPTKPAARADGVTVAEFLADYVKRHCEAEKLHMDSLEQRIGKISERFGAMLLKELENPTPIEDLKADLMKKGRANATVNRYLSQLRHMINWADRPGPDGEVALLQQAEEPGGREAAEGGEPAQAPARRRRGATAAQRGR